MQGIVQRLQVRIQFLLHVAWKKTQSFSGLHSRSCQDQFLDFSVFQCSYSQSDGCIGLAGAGRTEGEDKVVLVVFVHQPALVSGLGSDYPSLIAVDYIVGVIAFQGFLFLHFTGVGLVVQEPVQLAVAQDVAFRNSINDGLQTLFQHVDFPGISFYSYFGASGQDFHIGKVVPDLFQKLVVCSVYVHGIYAVYDYGLLSLVRLTHLQTAILIYCRCLSFSCNCIRS